MPPYKVVADIPEQTVTEGENLRWMEYQELTAAKIQFWEQAIRTNLGILFMPTESQYRDGRWRWQNEDRTVTVITNLDGIIESISKPAES